MALEISSFGCEEGHDQSGIKCNLNRQASNHQVFLETKVEGVEKEFGDYPRHEAVVAASVLHASSLYQTRHMFIVFQF
jgi:hypothetical protein